MFSFLKIEFSLTCAPTGLYDGVCCDNLDWFQTMLSHNLVLPIT